MGFLEGFLYGIFGGCLAEILGLFKLRREDPSRLPIWLKSIFYWIVTLLMIGSGGILVVIYLKSNFSLNPFIAVNVGASAPLIIGTLTSQAPDPKVGRVD
ncbi:MAG: hypothetical protein JW786_04140 [Desulfobacterales bacterium]|nr:hypothetical protein [Desulfobacterales bacterium]